MSERRGRATRPDGKRPIELIVKPRKPAITNLPVMAYDINSGEFLTEDGEISSFEKMVMMLPCVTPSIIITNDSAELLYHLNEKYKDDERWNYRVTPILKGIHQVRSAKSGHRVRMIKTMVNWCGWKRGIRSNKNRYHMIIDPTTFSSFHLESHDVVSFLEWGKALRDFCVENNIKLKPTQGGVARQFLQDKRFYPNPRRKVPRATNEKVRPHLPGSYYEISRGVFSTSEYTGIYIDQTKAHHFHAENTRLPDANTLLAYGNFRNDSIRGWRTKQERIDSFLNGFTGLIYGRLQYRPLSCRWIPPYLYDTSKPVWWYTSERDILDSLGAKPIDIIAAWGSKDEDTGLSKFAQWAQSIDNPPSWLKPLLLSTYGVLATTPHQYQTGYRLSTGGENKLLLAGRHTIEAKIHTTHKVCEPGTNNVLHRGLIEAATRTESLMFANYLQSKGHTVLSVYVDAVIIMDKGLDLPIVPDPWRVKHTLHHLRFISSNAFTSDELRKIPGGQTREAVKNFRPSLPNKHSHVFFNLDRKRVKRVRIGRNRDNNHSEKPDQKTEISP